ncbi:MAG TPA: helix-turn-helix domain-containing protein [Candidatus Limnocylindrales bacterium]|nr:helix-turn-helix domain-containing protein [Candidatus Limnocylindrales bacterium]
MARTPRSYSPVTLEAARLLGARVRLARRRRRWTAEELGNRIGADRTTVGKIERGDPSVGLGLALEAAAILRVPLFDTDDDRRAAELRRVSDELALLPQRSRIKRVDDDF